MKILKNIKFLILYFCLFHFFIPTNKSFSEIINSFEVKGNDRVSKETIVMFSELKIGQDVDSSILNNTIKTLFDTNYFKKVNLKLNEGRLIIDVIENPIIQSIDIRGIKDKTLYGQLEEIVKKEEKYPFIEIKVEDQITLLNNIVRAYGYYFAKIDSKIEINQNNTVNLIYNFNLGEIAKIKKISFIGNKIFKDSKLRNVIVSEESKFWKFLTRNKFLDGNRIKLDEKKLLNFYKNKGYFYPTIKSSSAIILDQNQFELIFNIDAGKKYYFNDIVLDISDEYSEETFNDFYKKFNKLKGKKYSNKVINNIVDEINKIALQKEFLFVNADYTEIIVDQDKINVLINFKESKKFYVERINVLGNYITEEKVVRNSLIIDEGDAFNEILFNKSIDKIRSKNIFKSVEPIIKESNSNKKLIDIVVEEKPTGEIFAGAGTGTAGSSISAGVKESNYLGKGIKLDTNLILSDDEIKGKFSVINPNFKNSDKSLNTTIESTVSDFMTSNGYKTTRTGFSFGTGFEQANDLFVNLDISNYYEKLETSDKATDIKKKQEGDYFENLVSYSLVLNKLDQNYQPSDGYLTRFSQTFPLYSDDWSIENAFNFSKYHSLNDNLILSAKFSLSSINSLDDNVRVSKRIYIPGRNLRGFESGGIGPKDGDQFVGGNFGSSLNLNTTLPNVFYGYENIDFNLFLDFANLWKVDYDDSLDSNKVRSSTGLSVNWFSPIGPLSFSYAVPLSKASTDKTESFRFQIGTSF